MQCKMKKLLPNEQIPSNRYEQSKSELCRRNSHISPLGLQQEDMARTCSSSAIAASAAAMAAASPEVPPDTCAPRPTTAADTQSTSGRKRAAMRRGSRRRSAAATGPHSCVPPAAASTCRMSSSAAMIQSAGSASASTPEAVATAVAGSEPEQELHQRLGGPVRGQGGPGSMSSGAAGLLQLLRQHVHVLSGMRCILHAALYCVRDLWGPAAAAAVHCCDSQRSHGS